MSKVSNVGVLGGNMKYKAISSPSYQFQYKDKRKFFLCPFDVKSEEATFTKTRRNAESRDGPV